MGSRKLRLRRGSDELEISWQNLACIVTPHSVAGSVFEHRYTNKKTFCFHRRSFQRQRADSNRRIRVLQTRPLPTWVRRHNCRRNIGIFHTFYKGSRQKKLKKLFLVRETALVENKIARMARRSMDEKPTHPAARARRLSTGNPRTMAQGPPCKLCSLQRQERPHSRFRI